MSAAPSIDARNPFYCPSVTASAYLNSLRRQLRRQPSRGLRNIASRINTTTGLHSPISKHRFVSSFVRVLGQALSQQTDNCLNFGTPQPSFDLMTRSFQSNTDTRSSSSSIPIENTFSQRNESTDTLKPPSLKRKRVESPSLTDFLRGPAKHHRTLNSNTFQDVSFLGTTHYLPSSSPPPPPYVELCEPSPEDRITKLQDALYGPPVGPESPRGFGFLIKRLDDLLPGIRLRERLYALEEQSHQAIADYLGRNGFLNPRVLNLLRTSEITSLYMSHSIGDEDGLNLGGREALTVFSKPNSFLFLSELSFSGAQLDDFDLTHIQWLPRLNTLFLDNTGIGNEAIFLLVSLKRTLTRLSIAMNPDINDDAVPALTLLSKISLLSLFGTGIGMPGLRRIAKVVEEESRFIDIEIPDICDIYIDDMATQYLLEPTPPLITCPALCEKLSAAALKRNLAAHAMSNPEILAGGTKVEMRDRLKNILEIRKMDMLVRSMIFGQDVSIGVDELQL